MTHFLMNKSELDYYSNPSVPLQERIYNIILRLKDRYPNGKVPIHVIRSFMTDATRREFDFAIEGLELKKKIEFGIKNDEDREKGIFIPGRGLLWTASEAQVIPFDDEESEDVSSDEEEKKSKEPKQRLVQYKKKTKSGLGLGDDAFRKSALKTSGSEVGLAAPPSSSLSTQGLTAPGAVTLTPLLPEGTADRHPVAVFLARSAPTTRITALSTLKILAKMLGEGDIWTTPWQNLRYQHTVALRTKLASKYSPGTANKMLVTLRGVLREAMRLGLMSGDDYVRARDMGQVKGTRTPKGRMLLPDEIRKLFGTLDPSNIHGTRNLAILGLLIGAGLRRSEIINLDFKDFKSESVVARGKGNKEREVQIGPRVQQLIQDWIQKYRGENQGPLFFPVTKMDKIRRQRLSSQTIFWLSRELRKHAHLEKDFSPHDFRRTYISTLLEDRNNDLVTISKMVGHESPKTTAQYDVRGVEAQKRAAASIEIPIGGI